MNPTDEQLQNIIDQIDSVSDDLEMAKHIDPGEFLDTFLSVVFLQLHQATEDFKDMINEDYQ